MEMTDEHRIFLNDLRDSGVTNMFGAGSYLEECFDMDGKDARDVLMQWMKSFRG
tara:strand:- start:6881 stop:7042 length:162 start_codon:yes stop_codon:yes gene_type:complete